MSWKVPLFKIYTDNEDIEQVSEVIISGMNWATGPKIPEFEKKVADYTRMNYAVSFNSGTSALHALLIAYGIGAGDEVIVPSFTFISTANSVKFVGAKPVFADIESCTYGLNPEDIRKKITDKTKAIMPIHVGGCPCRIEEIKEIAEESDLLLFEDAAESLGSMVNGRKVGTFGDSSMFSFCGPKVITTGEGGIIVTNSQDIFEKLKLLRSHGRADTKDYFSTNEYMDYVSLGYNFRMSNITAALGIAQMNKIDKAIEMRRSNSDYLTKKLNDEVEFVKTPCCPKGYYHLYQMYTIRAPNRDELMNYLSKKGIMAKVYFPPVHESHYYKNILHYNTDLPITNEMENCVLTLPMYPDLSRENMDYVVDCIKEFYVGIGLL